MLHVFSWYNNKAVLPLTRGQLSYLTFLERSSLHVIITNYTVEAATLEDGGQPRT